MLESLIITLREGVEAALVVGIIYAFLQKEGQTRHLKAVWAGLAAAVAASFAVGLWLRSVAINEEVFEGILYVASALVVGTFLVWMWRHARSLAGEMQSRLSKVVAGRSAPAVAAGIFLFTFLMVFREGVETVLFLAAVSLTTSGLMALLGTVLGLGLAVWFGVLFIRGSVRMDLGRFFRVTSIALGIFVVQLLLNGYHELSEGGWLPASPTTMGVVGPLVRNEFFFIVAVLALPLLAIAVPPSRPAAPAAPAAEDDDAVDGAARRRLARREALGQRRVRLAASAVGIAIIALLGLGFTYSKASAEVSPAEPLALDAAGEARIPLAELPVGELGRYQIELDGRPVRIIVMQLEAGEVVTGFDACVICGPMGYLQDGPEVVCRHCGSAIFPPTIGQPGGCNPIPLDARIEGDEVVVDAAALGAAAEMFG